MPHTVDSDCSGAGAGCTGAAADSGVEIAAALTGRFGVGHGGTLGFGIAGLEYGDWWGTDALRRVSMSRNV